MGQKDRQRVLVLVEALNNTASKATAEVGAMAQALQAGNRGGPARLRVRGKWRVSPATWADMKVLAEKLELAKLEVVDADGSVRTFEPRKHGDSEA